LYDYTDYGFFLPPFDFLHSLYQSFVKMVEKRALKTYPQMTWLTRLFIAFEAIERVQLKKNHILVTR